MGLKHEDESREAALQLFAHGMSQQDIAKAMGIAQSTVSRWCGTVEAETLRETVRGSLAELIASIGIERDDDYYGGLFDEGMRGWGFEPSGPDCDSHAHGLANGVWKCLEREYF